MLIHDLLILRSTKLSFVFIMTLRWSLGIWAGGSRRFIWSRQAPGRTGAAGEEGFRQGRPALARAGGLQAGQGRRLTREVWHGQPPL